MKAIPQDEAWRGLATLFVFFVYFVVTPFHGLKINPWPVGNANTRTPRALANASKASF